MTNPRDAIPIFAFLALFQLWGGAAIGAGIRGRRGLPLVWGALLGAVPLAFGIERMTRLGEWLALLCQLGVVAAAALAVGCAAPRLRALLLSRGMTTLMIGTLIMAAGATLGAFLSQRSAEIPALIIGGAGFLFGAMWFGAGIQQLRGKP